MLARLNAWIGQRLSAGALQFMLPCLLVVAACDEFTNANTDQAQPVYTADAPDLLRARAAASRPGTYVVQPGDIVRVFVFENPDLSQSFVVGPDGKFRYPLIGQISARGRSLSQLEAALRAGLSQTIVAPQVSVTLVEFSNYRIFVDGEVVQPGEFQSDAPVSIVQAIAMAGGFTAFASRDDVIIYNPQRNGGQRIVFNYDLFVRTNKQPDIFLLPGDTVIVR